MKLFVNALVKFACGLVLVGALLFVPAGTVWYPGGLLLLVLLFVPMFFAGIMMCVKSPQFLAKRLDAKEKQGTQKGVIAFSGIMFVAGFVVAGLDFRFGWSEVPLSVVIAASVVFLASYVLYAEVMRENAYLSRTVKVEQGQRVVDTGLYALVRHPMYMTTILLFMVMPLILGSWYALIAFAFYPMIIIIRLKDEEELLVRELAGYDAYKKKVKYRIIPFIW